MGLENVVLLPAMKDADYTKNVGKILGVPVGEVDSKDFEDSDPYFKINLEVQDVSGRDAFFVSRYHSMTSRAWIEAALFGNAAKIALASKAHLIETYCGCSRMERITRPGEALSMQAKANSFMGNGIDTFTTFAIHADAIQGFFDPSKTRFGSVPIWPLFVTVVDSLVRGNTNLSGINIQYVAPDAGAAKPLENMLHCSTIRNNERYIQAPVIIHKDRVHQGLDAGSKSGAIIGSVNGYIAVITDDEINSAGTICEASRICKDGGAVYVILAAAHGKYGREARGIDKLQEAIDKKYIDMLIVTNTGELFPKLEKLSSTESYTQKIVMIPTEPLVADVIEGIVTPGMGYSHLYSSRRVTKSFRRIARKLEDMDLDKMPREKRINEILFRDQMCERVLGKYQGHFANEAYPK